MLAPMVPRRAATLAMAALISPRVACALDPGLAPAEDSNVLVTAVVTEAAAAPPANAVIVPLPVVVNVAPFAATPAVLAVNVRTEPLSDAVVVLAVAAAKYAVPAPPPAVPLTAFSRLAAAVEGLEPRLTSPAAATAALFALNV